MAGGTWKDGTTTVFILRGVFGGWTLEGTTLGACHGGKIVALVVGGTGGTASGDCAVGGVWACVGRIDGCHGGGAGMHCWTGRFWVLRIWVCGVGGVVDEGFFRV